VPGGPTVPNDKRCRNELSLRCVPFSNSTNSTEMASRITAAGGDSEILDTHFKCCSSTALLRPGGRSAPYPLLVDFTKHLLQALQLGAEALGRERIPTRPSQLAATFQNLDSQFNAFVRMRHGAFPANVTLAVLVPGN
jgi:hypothetical protein